MNKILYILFFFFSFSVISLADTWTPITNLPSDLKPRRVFVYDNGYVVSGKVYKSTGDNFGAYRYNGQNYELLYRAMYYNVSFDVSPMGSYAISYNTPPYYVTATAFNLNNTTWGIQTSMGQPVAISSRIFLLDTNKFCVGASNVFGEKVIASVFPNNNFSQTVIGANLLALKFINQTLGYGIFSSQATNGNQDIKLYKTIDAGDHWTIIMDIGEKPAIMQFPSDISFIDNNRGYMNVDSLLYFTTNSGLNWNLISNFTGSIMDAYFTDSNLGYAVTKTGESVYQLVKTINHGQSWNLEMNIGILPAETYGYSGHVLHGNGNIILVVSDSTVYHRTEITGTGEVNTQIPNRFVLKQNYPNPFNPATVIKYFIPKQTMVKIKIYDINGKKINELINSSQTAGNHEVTFNGTNLSSGTYFYKIEAGEFTETKKMILIK